MVTEIARITVAQGNEAAFEKAMREGGLANLSACPGVSAVRFGQGIEDPTGFAFVVEWESVEAHAAAKDTESFVRFREAIGPYGIAGTMEHFRLA